ncbi:MAG: GNAT family N-acetyltransferase, partial [Acetobacteraceae bacterium]|nr:GNAT family N-acetyltransferase [Acetobacteraceae bacterium]
MLVACVAEGAALGFLRPPAREHAAAFWQERAARLAAGRAVQFAAWSGGVLAGAVTLRLDMPEKRRHRAVLSDLMAHPAFRRRGLGRALLRAAEGPGAGGGAAAARPRG